MRPARVLVLAGLLLAACRNEPAPSANRAKYRPPADGRLTEEQVRTYLSEAPKSAEYQWVAARVREARTAGLTRGMDRKIADSRRRILSSLEERRRTLKDPARQAKVDRQIAEVRRLLRGAPPEVPPAIRENAELVARLEKEKP
ncbi:MAG: hypothetical protein QOH06_4003 [Acidobacteriota bacterium]|jgi:hypothetical protein|nr:hypothetical protein [Acidobacteriota bacterium]